MRVALGLAASCGLAGCTAFVVTPDVIGPNDQHFVELQCPTNPGACRALAQKNCKGGFESAPGKDPEHLLVQCKPYVVGTDIIGPHGEHLIEIDCPSTTKACMDFARKTCAGDYDIFSTSPMLVQCQSAQLSPETPPPPGPWPVPPPPSSSPAAPSAAKAE